MVSTYIIYASKRVHYAQMQSPSPSTDFDNWLTAMIRQNLIGFSIIRVCIGFPTFNLTAPQRGIVVTFLSIIKGELC